ncbi:MAG: HD domain-containing protein [Chloroflexota bacterium]|nr:HD domain-containing protein [Chloroflexota bacterium]
MVEQVQIGRISDPVHGYIEFTGLERLILDYPVAQRLRNVAQSGLAHYVFPEVRTSRFSHCLGTMHLASALLTACMQNSSSEIVESVVNAARQLLQSNSSSEAEDFSDPPKPLSEDDSRILQAHVFCRTEKDSANHRAMLIIEQALRLAALFHDLGHLPFSHDFEEALNDLNGRLLADESVEGVTTATRGFVSALVIASSESKWSAIHERIGLGVAKQLLRVFVADLSEFANTKYAQNEHYVNRVATLAFRILAAREFSPRASPRTPSDNVVVWLHSLIAGDLDADRGDYLLRDGRNHGFEFAPYNLSRLLDNVVVATAPGDTGQFVLAVRPQGLSSVESLLLSRFRSYQFGVRHHKVAQIAAGLRYSIGEIITKQGSDREVRDFLDTVSTLAARAQRQAVDYSVDSCRTLLDRYAEFDDGWWMQVMRERLRHNPDEWLALVCWRRRGPKSLWKRTSHFSALLEEIGWSAGKSEDEQEGTIDHDAIARWNEQNRDFKHQADYNDAVAALRREGVLVLRHDFRPWTEHQGGSERLFVQREDGRVALASDFSALARALRQAWMNDVQVHAFAASDVDKSAQQVLRDLSPTRRRAEGEPDDQGVLRSPRRSELQ